MPRIAPSRVCAVRVAAPSPDTGSISFARPKSSTFTRPCSFTMMFEGFRSRCTIPDWWAVASASAICAPNWIARAGSMPSGGIRSASVWPATYSMAMKSTPSATSMS